MYTVFLLNNSLIFKSGFTTWKEAYSWGNINFGFKNFEIERE